MSDNNKEIKLVIRNLIIYLNDKNLILSGENLNLLNAISYLIKNTNNNNELKNNLEKLKQGTLGLKHQLDSQQKQIESIKEENSSFIVKFIILDCIRKKLIVLSSNLAYLSSGYSSMVDGYMSDHKDIIPNITRRFNSTNLHFYYNKKLKENYKKLKENYFGCKSTTKDTNETIFSTWSHTAQEHVKTIFIKDEITSDNWKVGKFIAMNFWFLERPLAFSVVNHELSHIIYMQEEHTYKIASKKNKYLKKVINSIKQHAFSAKKDEQITKNLITAIYQEIHCDLAAYSLDGVGYFYALFFTVMLGDISNFFFEDNEEISILKEKFLKIEAYECSQKNISCREWVKKSTNISIYVRLKILLDLIKDSPEYEKYLKDEKNIYCEYRFIDGIDKIISLIYCDKNLQSNIPTMLDILANNQKASVSYQKVVNYTQLIYQLFKTSFIDTKQKKLKFKLENISKDNKNYIQKIIKWRENNLDDEHIKKISENKTIDTLLWRYRILSLLEDKKEFVNRSSRRFAMESTLELTIDEDITPEEATYELISFNFQGKGFIDDAKKSIVSILKGVSKDYKIFYNFDIYEISVLIKLTRIEIDSLLEKIHNTYNGAYMITRYILFKLDKHQQPKNKNHIATIFVKVINREENCKKFLEYYQKNIKHSNDITIYKSMGSEDFIIMAYSNSFDVLHDIANKFKNLSYIQSLEYVYGIDDIEKIESCKNFKLRVYIKYKTIKTLYKDLETKSGTKDYMRVTLSNYFHEYIETDRIGDIKEILHTIENDMVEAKFEIVKYNTPIENNN